MPTFNDNVTVITSAATVDTVTYTATANIDICTATTANFIKSVRPTAAVTYTGITRPYSYSYFVDKVTC